jgi:V8-like Glu-specific endopeptidase
MKKKHLIGILAGLLGIVQQSYGQISEGGEPYTFSKSLESQVSSYNLTANLQNLESSIRTDTIESDTVVTFYDPIIGEVFPANINQHSHGTWDVLDNNDKIWRLKVNSNAGSYIMLIFNDFYLPKGTSLYIYSSDKTQLLGAFTSKNNTSQNKFTTTPLKCNSLILEYYKPSWVTEQEHLSIQSIGLITKDFANIMNKELGESGDCMINAKCPEYENWCNQRRSVALIIRVLQDGGQIRWCSGSLVTNERRDGKPLLLTAFHCIDNDPDNGSIEQSEKDEIQNWVFVFNYQSSDCANPTTVPSLMYSISGATYVNSHKKSDYALLQLNQKPPKNYNVFYNGWSNDKDDMTNTGVCIHHPSGDIKKISEWNKKTSLLVNYWRVKYTAGSTEGGSSGSALFNSSGYVVGQLKMGLAACGNNKADYFGRFDKSWHKFGLSWELNPNGTHSGSSQHYISSMSGDETCRDDWYFASGNDLHTSANVNFLNLSSIGTRQYDGVYNAKNSIVAENVTIQAGTSVTFEAGNKIVLKPGFHAEAGSNFVAKIGYCERGCGNGFKMAGGSNPNQPKDDMTIVQNEQEIENIILEKNKEISDTLYFFDETITIFPNPNDGSFEISLPFKSEEIYRIQVINQTGQIVFEKTSHTGTEINIPNPIPGMYFVSVVSKGKVFTQKIIIK